MMKQWLMRRAVRMPLSCATTAAISSSVCRLPFISASAFPSRTSATALAAESWLCSEATSGKPEISMPAAPAASRDPRGGPDQDRRDQPQLGGLHRPGERDLVAGMCHRRGDRRQPLRGAR